MKTVLPSVLRHAAEVLDARFEDMACFALSHAAYVGRLQWDLHYDALYEGAKAAFHGTYRDDGYSGASFFSGPLDYESSVPVQHQIDAQRDHRIFALLLLADAIEAGDL